MFYLSMDCVGFDIFMRGYMLRKIIKGEGANNSEEKLVKIARETFLDLWSYPNVYSDEGISKQKIGKEVCDLLVVFENNVIIFSDKNIYFNDEIDVKVAWPRWFRNSILSSCKQLFGAEKFIKKFPERLYIDKECKTRFPVSITTDMRVFLIATTSNTSKSAQEYYNNFAVGSSGSLMNDFFLDANGSLNNPFKIGDLYPDKTFVHVLDEENINLIFNHVTTITDFVMYLSEKEKAIRCQGLIGSGGEESTLALYLLNNQKLIEEPIQNPDYKFIIHEYMWDEYINSPEAELNKAFLRGSLFWDQLIQQFSLCILEGNVGLGQENDFQSHEMALRELAAESRISRYMLSNNFLEKLKQVPSDRRSARLVESIENKGKFFLFLFFPRTPGQSYDEYREERVSYIYYYSLVAQYKYGLIKKLVVIANETKLSEGRSEDIIAFDSSLKLDKESRVLAKKLMREEKILDSFLIDSLAGQRSIIPTNRVDKVGRNELCPCGSGNKYKKCHGLQ